MEEETHKRYGLLGRTLGHSFSPRIHQLLGGYEDGTFRPEGSITRAEFCTMVAAALNH